MNLPLPDHECTIEFTSDRGERVRATRAASGHWYPDGLRFGYLEPNLRLIYGITCYTVVETGT